MVKSNLSLTYSIDLILLNDFKEGILNKVFRYPIEPMTEVKEKVLTGRSGGGRSRSRTHFVTESVSQSVSQQNPNEPFRGF